MTHQEMLTLSDIILDACKVVQRHVGIGGEESDYEHCLVHELKRRNIAAVKRIPTPVMYEGKEIYQKFGNEILVENEIVVEIESACRIPETLAREKLRAMKKQVGIFVDFGVSALQNGYRRLVSE